MSDQKKIVIIAGPNGAGKTTFAREFLPRHRLTNFRDTYRQRVNYWQLFDNSGETPLLLDEGANP